MEKDFSIWHCLKTGLQKHEKNPYFSEREVWLCSIGLNVGHEEDGKGNRFLRPVIVFKKFVPDAFWAIPLTSVEKIGPYYYRFSLRGRIETAVLSQMRSLDSKRLLRKMGMMSEEDFFTMTRMFSGLLPKIEIPLGERDFSEAEAHRDSSVAEEEEMSNII
jgi:mRNA interferase MazF